MAPHSSTLAWTIPWMEVPWRRAWKHTPVFLPEEFHGQRSLVSYSLWDRKELDMTERLTFYFYFILLLCVEGGIIHILI